MRRTPTEQAGPLKAAMHTGVEVILIGDSIPTGLPTSLVTAQRKVASTFDAEDVLAVLDTELGGRPLAGVVTWSDAAVETVAAVGAAHGVPTASRNAAAICRDKARMRSALSARRPDLCPSFARVGTWAQTLAAASGMNFPLVLKPVSGSGSKGIYRVETVEELHRAHEALTALVDPGRDPIFTGHAGDLILEEFLEGSEHSVEGVVHDGRIVVFGVTDKRTTEPFRLEEGHVFPSRLPTADLASVDDLVQETIAAFGLDNSAFHLECMVGPDGKARLVECAARGGGDFIVSDLIGASTGRHAATNVLRVALGEAPHTAPPRVVAGVRKIMADREGRFERVEGLDEALRLPGVEKIVLERPRGATVHLPPRDFGSAVIGAVIATAPTVDEVEAVLDAAVAALVPVIT
ncbi:ATP-grasp domain-containing protein [Propioniciclava sinopodophylli]|uniref:ATP-grasp domain-containing protein n=1 Tax=Propioniciclava sinopodophylli TaxID=1837344 RepID=A0A4Q9KDU4_9ACTN|nr:ATP-grasp domain-containing protein [Propioniciclava sinopodophylli]TBT85041.1 ATP-grasp domain-containing protein [Propioniciclava sinopodophylli]